MKEKDLLEDYSALLHYAQRFPIYFNPHDAGFFALVGLKSLSHPYAQNSNRWQRAMDLAVMADYGLD